MCVCVKLSVPWSPTRMMLTQRCSFICLSPFISWPMILSITLRGLFNWKTQKGVQIHYMRALDAPSHMQTQKVHFHISCTTCRWCSLLSSWAPFCVRMCLVAQSAWRKHRAWNKQKYTVDVSLKVVASHLQNISCITLCKISDTWKHLPKLNIFNLHE